ncbi:MAG: DUF4321 domain-containing protein [Ruminococcus callidus]
MKKFLVYLCSIVVAVILGGVIGNLCVGIAPLSWLDYAPPLHLKTHEWNLYVADLTFGIQSKFNIAQLLLTIIACCRSKIEPLIGEKNEQYRIKSVWRLCAVCHKTTLV